MKKEFLKDYLKKVLENKLKQTKTNFEKTKNRIIDIRFDYITILLEKFEDLEKFENITNLEIKNFILDVDDDDIIEKYLDEEKEDLIEWLANDLKNVVYVEDEMAETGENDLFLILKQSQKKCLQDSLSVFLLNLIDDLKKIQ